MPNPRVSQRVQPQSFSTEFLHLTVSVPTGESLPSIRRVSLECSTLETLKRPTIPKPHSISKDPWTQPQNYPQKIPQCPAKFFLRISCSCLSLYISSLWLCSLILACLAHFPKISHLSSSFLISLSIPTYLLSFVPPISLSSRRSSPSASYLSHLLVVLFCKLIFPSPHPHILSIYAQFCFIFHLCRPPIVCLCLSLSLSSS